MSNLSSLVDSDEFINNYESLSSLEDVVVGVDSRVLESIGSFQYKGQNLSDKKCPICIEEFTSGDELRHLPCGHHFHVPCIDTWLHKSKKCPLCKTHLQ
uniref:RING-type domain-containing protein n=1 Tax=Arcella intermedia TaxID=1963864 RepID=A0A6B2LUC3_9EUKA